ncbi:MAG TPA: hypothetical protein PK611_05305 [Saprospiraceae bacterium]|jgi:hypothetical protein|nr:hypothetical protein [Saprospiraceae bacterium]HRO73066.1 hypothetical protein [Saprospiraceae bacterium]HRP41943.1 hypothetical protein [Saprospiraceae bacterium]
MKKLEIPGGGMPFTGDDLLWLSDGLYDAVVMLAGKYAESHDSSGRGVITGLNVSVSLGVITLTEGWLLLGGQLCYCNGWTGSGALNNYELYFDPVYDPAGNDVFADNISRDTYKVQRASVRAATIPVDNDPTILRLSIIDEIRISIRIKSNRTTYISSSKTKAVLERYGQVCSLTIMMGNDSPVGNLFTIFPSDLPKSALLLRHIPMFTSTGVWKGVLTVDPISGNVSYIGTLPDVGEPSLFANLSWVI